MENKYSCKSTMCKMLGDNGIHSEPTWLQGWNNKVNAEKQGKYKELKEKRVSAGQIARSREERRVVFDG